MIKKIKRNFNEGTKSNFIAGITGIVGIGLHAYFSVATVPFVMELAKSEVVIQSCLITIISYLLMGVKK